MKKTLLKGLALAAVGSLMMVSSSMGSPITVHFDDTTIVFPDYTGTDFTEQIGNPMVTGMDVTYDSDTNYLLSVSIDVANRISFDSLLINDGTVPGAWNSWDYYVSDGKPLGLGGSTGTLTEDGLYRVTSDTITTYTHHEWAPGEFSGRTGHVNGLEGGNFLASLNPAYSSDILFYDFTGLTITLGDSWSIAYTPWCANDVIVGTVPEPATMLLFGAGLSGLAALSRKRKNI